MLDMDNDRHTHIDRRLRAEPIIWLSSVRPDGRPHLVPVWFLWDGATVLIFSQPAAQKVRNLAHTPQVMLALNTEDEGEDVVMLEGVATLLPTGTVDSTLPEFAAKYEQLMTHIGTDPVTMATAYTQAIRVTPTRFLPV